MTLCARCLTPMHDPDDAADDHGFLMCAGCALAAAGGEPVPAAGLPQMVPAGASDPTLPELDGAEWRAARDRPLLSPAGLAPDCPMDCRCRACRLAESRL